jgi:hypothetical protein
MTEALDNGATEIPASRSGDEIQALGGFMMSGNLSYFPLTPSERELALRAQMPVEVRDLVPYDLTERFIANYDQQLPEGRKLPSAQQNRLTEAEFEFVYGLANVLRGSLTPAEAQALSSATMRVPQNGALSYLHGHMNARDRLGDTYLQRLAADAKQRLPAGLSFTRFALRQENLPLEAQMVRLMNRQTLDRHSRVLPLAAGSADILTAFGLWISNADMTRLFRP